MFFRLCSKKILQIFINFGFFSIFYQRGGNFQKNQEKFIVFNFDEYLDIDKNTKSISDDLNQKNFKKEVEQFSISIFSDCNQFKINNREYS